MLSGIRKRDWGWGFGGGRGKLPQHTGIVGVITVGYMIRRIGLFVNAITRSTLFKQYGNCMCMVPNGMAQFETTDNAKTFDSMKDISVCCT